MVSSPSIGLKSTTVDDRISERKAGTSKYTLHKMLSLALDGITSFSVKPIYYVIYLGIAFLFVTLCIGIYVIHAFLNHTEVAGWASLILSIWLVGAMLMISIGAVGVYIAKIYEEVKQRPLYNIMSNTRLTPSHMAIRIKELWQRWRKDFWRLFRFGIRALYVRLSIMESIVSFSSLRMLP